MEPSVWDCIVVGLGGHGSAAIASLSSKGKFVLGIEKFTPAHDQGSSHGYSRIIRTAYFEDPRYVPLLKRSMELWKQLQANNDGDILHLTGGLMIGKLDSHVISGTLASVREHALDHEILTSDEIKKRYGVFNVATDDVGIFESDAGYLVPENCIRAYLSLAEKNGAVLKFGEEMLRWTPTEDDLVIVETTRGIYKTKKLVLSVGAWAPEIYGGDILDNLHVERRVLYWFKTASEDYAQKFEKIPVYIWDYGKGNFYGFPSREGPPGGVKVAFHLQSDSIQSICTPDTIDRSVSDFEVSRIRDVLSKHIPSLNGELLATATCMYTVTDDEHFFIDFHPKNSNILLVSPCSGHGFKFCSVVGEIVSDLVLQQTTAHDISLFRSRERGERFLDSLGSTHQL